MARKNALGRGLGALIPGFEPEKVDNSPENFPSEKKLSTKPKENVDSPGDKTNKVLLLPLSKVEPREGQPRMIFDDASLAELAESIKLHGVLQPILVVDRGDHYEIVAGERRWRAAKQAGLTKIPAIVQEFKDTELQELALIENIQREDLNPIEEAQAYRQLLDEYGIKQEELAHRVSKSRTAVANSLRLLKLDERVQAMVMDGSLSEGHARALLGLADKKQQFELAGDVIAKQLSVRETEALVKRIKEGRPRKRAVLRDGRESAYDELVLQLRRSLGTRVNIRRTGENKGQIVIDYYSLEELEQISDRIRRG
ncbi:MAG: ParB/RepB/Spo0J family partition protein [Lachnospiraceae bacterium]|nr:ParB/RepB/Spo0J family partition protein [Lachnospiraceae bacterium]